MKMQWVQPWCSSPALRNCPHTCPLATWRDGTEPMDQAEAGPAPPGDWAQGGHMGHTCSPPARHYTPQPAPVWPWIDAAQPGRARGGPKAQEGLAAWPRPCTGRRTPAPERVMELMAGCRLSMVCGAAPTLTGLAVIDVGVAVAAGEAGSAGAAVAPIGVLACGPIAAGALHALVDVNLAGLTCGTERDRDHVGWRCWRRPRG